MSSLKGWRGGKREFPSLIGKGGSSPLSVGNFRKKRKGKKGILQREGKRRKEREGFFASGKRTAVYVI